MPKIHKENKQLIIFSINTPCHFLAKIVYSELKNAIPIPKSHINNSSELKKKLTNITVPDGYIFASLDVWLLTFYIRTQFSFSTKKFTNRFLALQWVPLYPLFADIVLDDLEFNCLKTLKNNFDCIPLFYYRYVDDILICIKEEQLNAEIFNNYNSRMNWKSITVLIL